MNEQAIRILHHRYELTQKKLQGLHLLWQIALELSSRGYYLSNICRFYVDGKNFLEESIELELVRTTLPSQVVITDGKLPGTLDAGVSNRPTYYFQYEPFDAKLNTTGQSVIEVLGIWNEVDPKKVYEAAQAIVLPQKKVAVAQ